MPPRRAQEDTVVLDQLNKIDTGPADALKALREEREVLEGRVKAMDDMKTDVAEAVYLRVRSDYIAKVNSLNEESRPLLDEARKQYAELKSIMAKLEAETDAINLDRQEIELRHKLGEFDAKEFGKRIKAIDEAAGEKSQWHARGTEIKERFMLAVSAEAELESAAKPKPAPKPAAPAPAPAPPPPAAAAPPPPHITAPQLEPVSLPNQTLEIAQSSLPNFKAQHLGEITNEISPPPPNATMMMPAVKAPGAAPAPPPPAAAAAAPMAPPPIVSESTVMFRPARLVPQNPEAGKATHALGLKPMLVGSDSANDIRVGGPGIEPRHAQIAPTAGGYVLTDFETKHGTRVNAEKVKERVLANEDVIQIGAARFVFRQ